MNTCDKCGQPIAIDEEYWDDREYERIGRDVNWVIPIPCYCRDCWWTIARPGIPKPRLSDERLNELAEFIRRNL